MKKITLSIALLIGILTSNAQDTICTMIRLHEVINFNHNPTEIISRYDNNEEVFIEVGINKVLCLHLYDKSDVDCYRKITYYYRNGEIYEETVNSIEYVVYIDGDYIYSVTVSKLK